MAVSLPVDLPRPLLGDFVGISGGSVGWGTTGELLGSCSLTWHGGRDRQA
jgi:hypothetical protein